MNRFSLKHLSNEALRRGLTHKAANENEATVELIAHIAEFDARKLYLPAAYGSMLTYCVGELGLSEDAAKKRIQVARVARDCPAVFEALAAGRVHLSGLRLLAPHLCLETADELLAAAAHRSMDEIERLLAERHPRLDVPVQVDAVPPQATFEASGGGAPAHLSGPEVVANTVNEGAARHPRARVTPLSAEAYAVQFTRSRDADKRFRHLQDLLGHQVSRVDIAEVYDRAVRELITKMGRVRFGACARPRAASSGSSEDPRHISADVKREVWRRDGGRCTYESESGRRCEVRGDVEFDHKTEVARGGEATVDNLQLRCRGHNQYTAEQTFGPEFMQARRGEAKVAAVKGNAKREEAKAAAARQRAERAKANAHRRAEREKQAEESRLLPHELEVIPWLRQLGCREDESRIAVRRCREMADAPLENRVKRALSWFGDRIRRVTRPMPAAPAMP